MKKGERKFLIVLVVLFVLYVATSFLAPKPIDWSVTFASNDKNPFGAYILSERSSDLFGEPFRLSNRTISELTENDNLIILADVAEIARADYRNLMIKLDSGANVFVAANQFSAVLKDSLEFDERFSFHVLNQTLFEAATSEILVSDSLVFEYPYSLVSNYFEIEQDSDWEVQATLDSNPILITKKVGEGKLILSSTPYVFTNFGLLFNENFNGAARLLTELPHAPTHFTTYYQLGKGEATTPFRYFLKQPPLRWSLYLTLILLVIFLTISSRRVQRAIPLFEPPQNSTVNYVRTLGTLFYREGNHKKAGQRLINHFLKELSEKYFIKMDYSERTYRHLSAKSGVELMEVIQTFELVQRFKNQEKIDEQTLINLSKKIDRF